MHLLGFRRRASRASATPEPRGRDGPLLALSRRRGGVGVLEPGADVGRGLPALDGILADFVAEARENLDRLDAELVGLELCPDDAEALRRVLRVAHSLKGTAGVLGFRQLEGLAHAGETLLCQVREGLRPFDERVATAVLTTADAVRALLDRIEVSGGEGDLRFGRVLENLEDLSREATAPDARALEGGAAAGATDQPPPPPAQPWAGPGAPAPSPARYAPAPSRHGEAAPQAADALTSGADGLPDADPSDRPHELRSVRLDVALLDRLMDDVGELVLARNRIAQLAAGADDAPLRVAVQRLGVVAGELQARVARARLRPVATLWRRLPRLVRDVALACGKEATVATEGGDVELDRRVLEAVADPLTHLVRNAIDHGLEPPAVRRASGKPAAGRIVVRARQGAGLVEVEVEDDGRGIDLDAIRRRALDRGLLPPQQARALGLREALELVFRPGFTTADAVSSVSGRGVGLDVVRAEVRRVGGDVQVETTPGGGTTFRLRIPLTLAIVPILLLRLGALELGIPQLAVLELLRLRPDHVQRAGDAPVLRHRGRLLPLVPLARLLEVAPGPGEAAGDGDDLRAPGPRPAGLDRGVVVVVAAGARSLGLVVDDVLEAEEVVIKPLPLLRLPVYAGATVRGDGRPALVLDPAGVARRAGVRDGELGAPAAQAAPGAGGDDDADRLLVLGLGGDERVAVALDHVARLEEVDPARVARAGEQAMVPLGGRVLPLLDLPGLLARRPALDAAAPRALTVVVHDDGRRAPVGLIVTTVEDVVAAVGAATGPGARPGVLCTKALADRLVEVLDVPGLIRHHAPGLAAAAAAAPGAPPALVGAGAP